MSARVGCGSGCAGCSLGCLVMLLSIPAVLVAAVVGRKRRTGNCFLRLFDRAANRMPT